MSTTNERIATVEATISAVCGDLKDMKATQISNHAENRKSIHDLRDGQQTMSNSMYLMKDELGKAIGQVKTDTDVRFARISGYTAGAAAVGGSITAIVLHFLGK